jgi:hypothetical protein
MHVSRYIFDGGLIAPRNFLAPESDTSALSSQALAAFRGKCLAYGLLLIHLPKETTLQLPL